MSAFVNYRKKTGYQYLHYKLVGKRRAYPQSVGGAYCLQEREYKTVTFTGGLAGGLINMKILLQGLISTDMCQ